MRYVLLLILLLTATPVHAANHAVIIMYHRFGEGNYPSTNVTMEQFQTHIDILMREGFTVKPVPEILDAIRDNKPLPDKTVGITIDDAALSVYTDGWPVFKKHRLPFTLFVTTDDIDRNSRAYMNWVQLRELRDSGLVTIGNHSKSHPSFAALTPLQIAQELSQSQQRLQDELGTTPELFAFPYGEYSVAAQQAVAKFGFKTAFGQHSGVLHAGSDWLGIPRFAFNENYSAAGRFRQAVTALPLPVTDYAPRDASQPTSPNALQFTVATDFPTATITCFLSDFGKADLKITGPVIDVALPQAWDDGRQRLNCTTPAPDKRYYWWGIQYRIGTD